MIEYKLDLYLNELEISKKYIYLHRRIRMNVLMNKINFTIIIEVNGCNPNGDPANKNYPRVLDDGRGFISSFYIKRKIRNRLQDMGHPIFLQSNGRINDGHNTLKDRAEASAALQAVGNYELLYKEAACREWIDVRAFGQVFDYDKTRDYPGIIGPVTFSDAFSVLPISIDAEEVKKKNRQKEVLYRVHNALYMMHGSINCNAAKLTGLSEKDADAIRDAILTMFQNTASKNCPQGSMSVRKLIWFKHNNACGQYTSWDIQDNIKVSPKVEHPLTINNYDITISDLDGLEYEFYDGK